MRSKDVSTVLASMLRRQRGVEVDETANRTSFSVGGKVFAFTRKDGVAVKLPAEHVGALSRSGRGVPLVMGKRTMKEWAIIAHEDASEYRDDLPLFKESIRFTSTGR
jgi:hypothetical protein